MSREPPIPRGAAPRCERLQIARLGWCSGMLVRVSGAAQRVQQAGSHHGRAAGPETRQASATWQVARACTHAKFCATNSDPG
jgi:hypothetical protein